MQKQRSKYISSSKFVQKFNQAKLNASKRVQQLKPRFPKEQSSSECGVFLSDKFGSKYEGEEDNNYATTIVISD